MATRRVHLTFTKELVLQPVLWQVCQEFSLVLNIRRADVQQDMGWVEVELDGEQEDLDKALKAFKDRGVRVDPIEVQTITG